MIDTDAQLARIAVAAPAGEVKIFELVERFTWNTWLCPRHLAEWQARGWVVRKEKEPPHALTCDDCHFEATPPTATN